MNDSQLPMIQAIERTSACIVDHLRKLEQNSPDRPQTVDEKSLRLSIELVSQLGAQLVQTHEQEPDYGRVESAILRASYAYAVQADRLDVDQWRGKISLLCLLGRRHDENLHSDFVAALLDPATTGELAKYFFCELFAWARKKDVAISPESVVFQYSLREVRLDTLDSGLASQPQGARRIDILATNNLGVLVIENKVLTYESERQTQDYADAVKKHYKQAHTPIGFIFLSPTGMEAESPDFDGMSYQDLFKIIWRLRKSGDWGAAANRLADQYLLELAKTFVQREQDSLTNSIRKLKEAGYDFPA